MRDWRKAAHPRQPAPAQRPEVEGRPCRHLPNDAGDERPSGHHHGWIWCEVRGDLDAVAARSHTDAGRLAIGGEQHHRRRQHVCQQSRKRVQPSRFRASARQAQLVLARRWINGHVIVRANPKSRTRPDRCSHASSSPRTKQIIPIANGRRERYIRVRAR